MLMFLLEYIDCFVSRDQLVMLDQMASREHLVFLVNHRVIICGYDCVIGYLGREGIKGERGDYGSPGRPGAPGEAADSVKGERGSDGMRYIDDDFHSINIDFFRSCWSYWSSWSSWYSRREG
jgi:hypothetical protein